MLNKYAVLLASAKAETDTGHRMNHLAALVRSITQVAAVTSLEIYADSASSDDELDFNEILRKIHRPSDGDPISILNELIPRIRSNNWLTYAAGWFEPLRHPTGHCYGALTRELQQWVTFRNDRPGHGVLDKQLAAEWAHRTAELVEQALIVLKDAVPQVGEDNNSVIQTATGPLQLRTPLHVCGEPIVIRGFRSKRGLWFLDGQILRWDSSPAVRLDVSRDAPTVGFLSRPYGKFQPRTITAKEAPVCILANVPPRQSSVFSGRESEKLDLANWLTDHESRACLVYGDGGVGKTTLVLEVINNLLDDELSGTAPYPTVVSFYSAKLTRWTTRGIEHFKNVSTAVEDAIRELILVIEDTLSQDWYGAQDRMLIDKVSNYLREAGLARNDILLILDNTETMVRKPGDEENLVKLIEQICRKVARVLLTSRRREKIEAHQVELLPMPELDALYLLRRLGEEYSAEAIKLAGDARLRRIASRLGRKPLLLDVFARHVAATRGSLDDAYQTVMQGSVEGLSEFLYEDAWMRMSESHRSVFMSITCLDIPLTARTVGLVCRELEVPHTEWLNSFYEAHFGQITDYGSDYQLELGTFARDFFKLKLSGCEQQLAQRLREVSRRVEDLTMRAERALKDYGGDRVHEAFKTPSARAAKVAAARGDIRGAREWYEEAVREDPNNSYLHDRYAWFLMVMAHDLDEAIRMAGRALHIEPKNADANLTMALVLYRMGNLADGDQYLTEAVRLGKSEGLGLLRKGIARYHAARNIDEKEQKSRLLSECVSLLRNARVRQDPWDHYAEKNTRDAETYIRKALAEANRLRGFRVERGNAY